MKGTVGMDAFSNTTIIAGSKAPKGSGCRLLKMYARSSNYSIMLCVSTKDRQNNTAVDVFKNCKNCTVLNIFRIIS